MTTTTERRLLMLRLDTTPDPDNILSWTVGGRQIDTDEVRLLHGLTTEDAAAIVDLLRLQLELQRTINDERWGGAS